MLRERISDPVLTLVPVVFNAMSAMMARSAGFAAGYVGGASLGYLRGTTEAALTPHDFVAVGLEIGGACPLPLIGDAGCGWGDAVHMHRFVPLLESAGYAALEIEDQVVPKRAHHHIGIEHLVPVEAMAAKIAEAVRVRRAPDLLIIARTNAMRDSADAALRRCEAYAEAGADMLFPVSGDAEKLRYVGRRTPLPLMLMVHPGQSLSAPPLPADELVSLGYRLLVDGISPFAAMYETLERTYDSLAECPPFDRMGEMMNKANLLVGLPDLLAIERRTTERETS